MQWSEAVNEVKLLMEKMMMVQQQGEEFTQEEMVTRFERERTETLLEPVEGINIHTDNSIHFCWVKIVFFLAYAHDHPHEKVNNYSASHESH